MKRVWISRIGAWTVIVAWVCGSFVCSAVAADKGQTDPVGTGGNWPQWRGPNRDNVSSEKGLLNNWPEAGPPLRWRVEGIGDGIASVSVAGGRILTVGYRQGSEYAVALNESSGDELWSTRIGPSVQESSLMRWLSQRSPTVDVERAYFVTASGDLVCLNCADGRELWRKSYSADFGGRGGWWRFCDYPLVDGDNLICTPGGAEVTFVALNKATGAVVWKMAVPEGDTAAYAAMVVANPGGVRQYVTFLQKGLVSLAADDGHLLWRYDKLATDQNSLTPLVLGDHILCASGRLNPGIAMLRIAPTGKDPPVNEEYFQPLALNHFQDNLVAVDGYLYGTTLRGPVCVELATGKIAWEAERQLTRTPMTAMVAADGHLYLRRSDGLVTILEANPKGIVVKGSFSLPDLQPSIGATNPVIAGGRLYLRDDSRLFCYDVSDRPSNEPPPVAKTIKLDMPQASVPPIQDDGGDATKTSVFVPTPQDVVDKMLELADVRKTDVVYDLGSGDGRIVIEAAKTYGCKAIGYEIDKELVELSRQKSEMAGVKSLVTIELQDLFTADLSSADVIMVYLLPQQLEKLLPQLEQLKPGVRIVSHQFVFPGFSTDRLVKAESQDGEPHTIYLWTLPLKKLSK